MTRSPALPAVALGALLLAGCASQMLSDDRIVFNTAGVLGVSPAEIAITDRRTEGTNTYYTARTRSASYACTINGGNALTLGMVNPPVCTARAAGGVVGRTYGRAPL